MRESKSQMDNDFSIFFSYFLKEILYPVFSMLKISLHGAHLRNKYPSNWKWNNRGTFAFPLLFAQPKSVLSQHVLVNGCNCGYNLFFFPTTNLFITNKSYTSLGALMLGVLIIKAK